MTMPAFPDPLRQVKLPEFRMVGDLAHPVTYLLHAGSLVSWWFALNYAFAGYAFEEMVSL